jgi:hypothetical protein
LPRGKDARWDHYSKAVDVIHNTRPMLFDLHADIGETTDLAAQHPQIVARLMQHIEHARDDIGDVDRVGKNARFFDPGPKRPDIARKKRTRK